MLSWRGGFAVGDSFTKKENPISFEPEIGTLPDFQAFTKQSDKSPVFIIRFNRQKNDPARSL